MSTNKSTKEEEHVADYLKPRKHRILKPLNLPKQLEKKCKHGTKFLMHECDKCIAEFTEILKEFKVKANVGEQLSKLVNPSTRELIKILLQLIAKQTTRIDNLEARTL